jgi:peptidyl-prolyl cis-trans isomerase SurA
MKRLSVTLLAALAALTQTACKRSAPANVAAEVNKHAITFAELDRLYTQQYPQQAEGSSADQIMSQRLEVLNSLITREIMLQRAEKMGLQAVDSDVDAKIGETKAPYTKEQFEKVLADRKMTLDELRAQIRSELTVTKLINKEITSHIAISDADVATFYNANKGSFNLAEPQIRMAFILVTPNPDPSVRNLKNSKAQNEAEAKSKIADILARLNRGEDFAMLAQNYSEDPSTAPNGGDMGYVPESALDKVQAELRRVIVGLQPGAISGIIRTQEGYRILKLISKEPAGQRDLNDPRVAQSIRDMLLNRKNELLQSAYVETARNSATIHNYLAESVIENAGKTTAK